MARLGVWATKSFRQASRSAGAAAKCSAAATTPREQRPLLNGMVQNQISRCCGWVVMRIFSRSKAGWSMRSSMWVNTAWRTGKFDGASRSSRRGSTRP
ncbi:hypothetical protein D3C85_1676550 [compost metagenome]